jgi:hypothetical protein
MLKKISFYFYVFYCFEIGIFLMAAPWFLPNVWENNYFFYFVPEIKEVFLNPYFRGAVSGIGLLNVVLAISEVIQHERSKQMLRSGARSNSKV